MQIFNFSLQVLTIHIPFLSSLSGSILSCGQVVVEWGLLWQHGLESCRMLILCEVALQFLVAQPVSGLRHTFILLHSIYFFLSKLASRNLTMPEF